MYSINCKVSCLIAKVSSMPICRVVIIQKSVGYLITSIKPYSQEENVTIHRHRKFYGTLININLVSIVVNFVT